MIKFCKSKVPHEITDALEPFKNNDEDVRKYGIEFGIKQS